MVKPFTSIGLIGKHHRANISDTLAAVKDYLALHTPNVLIEQDTAKLLRDPSVIGLPAPELANACDLLIVIGGDGSLLHAAQVAVPHGTLVLGVNRGHLGFLTDIRPQELQEKITEVLNGRYQEEQRFLLKAQLCLENTVIASDIALNDVVLMPGDMACMIEFSITIDEQFVCAQRADGLIVATPTGSTAYALSGGGPILHPQVDALVLLPMFPHTLTARPIVVDANSAITIHMSANNKTRPWLRCDGQARIPVPPNTSIRISKHNQALRLAHPLDYNYFATLRTKLHWQKAFVFNDSPISRETH